MSGIAETKVCPHCAETIKAAARVCPNCRYWQKTWSLYNPKLLTALGFVVLMGCGAIMGILVDSITGQGKDFARYRDQIEVVTNAMSYSRTNVDPYITTIGLIMNRSEFGWKEVQLEAQYFDASGKLIDTGVSRNFETELLPHGEAAFRIRILADKPESSYASEKVYVRSAKDGRRLF
jgi:hypothetical protein